MSTRAINSNNLWAAWWNGVLSILWGTNVAFLAHWVWIHDVNGIVGTCLLGVFLTFVWFGSFFETVQE